MGGIDPLKQGVTNSKNDTFLRQKCPKFMFFGALGIPNFEKWYISLENFQFFEINEILKYKTVVLCLG